MQNDKFQNQFLTFEKFSRAAEQFHNPAEIASATPGITRVNFQPFPQSPAATARILGIPRSRPQLSSAAARSSTCARPEDAAPAHCCLGRFCIRSSSHFCTALAEEQVQKYWNFLLKISAKQVQKYWNFLLKISALFWPKNRCRNTENFCTVLAEEQVQKYWNFLLKISAQQVQKYWNFLLKISAQFWPKNRCRNTVNFCTVFRPKFLKIILCRNNTNSRFKTKQFCFNHQMKNHFAINN